MPFKDKLKKLDYGRKYQTEQRKKLKEVKELHDIEGKVVKIAREYLVGRQLFGIEQLPESGVQKPLKGEFISRIPVIHTDITLPITPHKIEEATLKMVEQEDTLLLTGEHKGWDAFGIEGLATAKGRNVIQSCGSFRRDLLKAFTYFQKLGYLPPYSIITNMRDKLGGTFPMVDNYVARNSLFTQEGKEDNMLVVKANQTNFVLLMAQDLSVCRLQNGGYKLWETLAPKICEPSAICEIQGVQ